MRCDRCGNDRAEPVERKYREGEKSVRYIVNLCKPCQSADPLFGRAPRKESTE